MNIQSLQDLATQHGDVFPRRDYGLGALAYRLGVGLSECPPECQQKEFERGWRAQAADFYLD